METKETTKQNILIVGPANSGKSIKALDLASKYSPEEITRIKGNPLKFVDMFRFAKCKKNTKVIILDAVDLNTEIENLISLVCLGIEVYKMGQDSFFITPEIIAVAETPDDITDIDQLDLPSSLLRRFGIVTTFQM